MALLRRVLKVLGILSLCLLCGAIGAGLTRLGGGHTYPLSYADFVSIMLTAIAVLMTVLAVFLAVAGFVGWTTIEQKVQKKTEEFLADGFRHGGRLDRLLKETIDRKTENSMFGGIEPLYEDADDNDEGAGNQRARL